MSITELNHSSIKTENTTRDRIKTLVLDNEQDKTLDSQNVQIQPELC